MKRLLFSAIVMCGMTLPVGPSLASIVYTSPFENDAVVVAVQGQWQQFDAGGQQLAPTQVGRIFFKNIQPGSPYYGSCAVTVFSGGLIDDTIVRTGSGNDVFQPPYSIWCAGYYWRRVSYPDDSGVSSWRNGRSITFDGGAGNDFIEQSFQGSSFAMGGAGTDTMLSGWEFGMLDGGPDNDYIRFTNTLFNGADRFLVGGEGNDCLESNNADGNDGALGFKARMDCGGGTGDKTALFGYAPDQVYTNCDNGTQIPHCFNLPDGYFCSTNSDCASGVCSGSNGQSCRPRLLLVVGAIPLSASDQKLFDQLSGSNFGQTALPSHNFSITTVSDAALATGDATGKALVVVSESVSSGNVGTKLTGVATPVLCLEPNLQNQMGMTGPGFGTNMGTTSGTTVNVISGGGASSVILKAGLNGNSAVLSASGLLNWGVPGGAAHVVSRIVGSTTQATSYKYDKSVTLWSGGAAPGKRAFFFDHASVVLNNNSSAWKLFDALVRWAATPDA